MAHIAEFEAPLDPHHSVGSLLSPQAHARWLWLFFALGLAVRTVRYLLRFPLWEDECFLGVNFLDRGFWDLTKPLDYHQAAPLLFLWIELASVKLLGFNEYALRFVPFVLSIAGLFLFRHLAARLVQGTALLVAFGLFAVAYPMTRYASEAKPYGFDLFVSLALLAIVLHWCRNPQARGWLWGLIAFAPLAVGVSYPAVFVGGGMSLVVARVLWTTRDRHGWVLWMIYNAVLVGSFLGFYWLVARGQSAAELEYMQKFWHHALVPYGSVGEFLLWLLKTHTSELFSYPIGGARGASTATAILWVAGCVCVWQARRYLLLLWCLSPLALNFLAALLHKYPYGGHMKFSQYAAPAICLIAGLGAAQLMAWNGGSRKTPRPALLLTLGLLVAVSLGTIGRDFFAPYKNKSDMLERDFARTFWTSMAHGGEIVCLKTDLGQEFSPSAYRELCWTASYLCNQRIYSPRHARREAPAWEKVSATWPLRCVQYESGLEPDDPARRQQWLDSMQTRYDLAGTESIPMPYYNQRGNTLMSLDKVEVFRFVPRAAFASPKPAPDASSLR